MVLSKLISSVGRADLEEMLSSQLPLLQAFISSQEATHRAICSQPKPHFCLCAHLMSWLFQQASCSVTYSLSRATACKKMMLFKSRHSFVNSNISIPRQLVFSRLAATITCMFTKQADD